MLLATTDRERVLALALLLAALLHGYFALAHLMWTVPMQEVDTRVGELRERERRIRTQLTQAPQVQRELSATLAQQAQRPSFLQEATVELATAGLLQRLEAIVEQARPGSRSCAIANQSPLAMTGREVYPRVFVQMACAAARRSPPPCCTRWNRAVHGCSSKTSTSWINATPSRPDQRERRR